MSEESCFSSYVPHLNLLIYAISSMYSNRLYLIRESIKLYINFAKTKANKDISLITFKRLEIEL